MSAPLPSGMVRPTSVQPTERYVAKQRSNQTSNAQYANYAAKAKAYKKAKPAAKEAALEQLVLAAKWMIEPAVKETVYAAFSASADEKPALEDLKINSFAPIEPGEMALREPPKSRGSPTPPPPNDKQINVLDKSVQDMTVSVDNVGTVNVDSGSVAVSGTMGWSWVGLPGGKGHWVPNPASTVATVQLSLSFALTVADGLSVDYRIKTPCCVCMDSALLSQKVCGSCYGTDGYCVPPGRLGFCTMPSLFILPKTVGLQQMVVNVSLPVAKIGAPVVPLNVAIPSDPALSADVSLAFCTNNFCTRLACAPCACLTNHGVVPMASNILSKKLAGFDHTFSLPLGATPPSATPPV